MSTPSPQVKKGYIRGVQGLVVTGLDADGGTRTPAATAYGIKTSPQVDVSVVVETGPATALRGGDKVLAYVKDPDTIVAANLTVRNARLDGQALYETAGGTLVTESKTEGEPPNQVTTETITGWQHPTIEDQQEPVYFSCDVYSRSFKGQGAVEGYLKTSFPYCRARVGNFTLQDGTFTVEEILVECFENPSTEASVYGKEIVDSLPTELTS